MQAFRNYEVTQHHHRSTASGTLQVTRPVPMIGRWFFQRRELMMVSNRGSNGLTLTRGKGEAVRITTASGEQIVVTVVRTRNGWAQLNFQADRSVTILRDELEDLQS